MFDYAGNCSWHVFSPSLAEDYVVDLRSCRAAMGTRILPCKGRRTTNRTQHRHRPCVLASSLGREPLCVISQRVSPAFGPAHGGANQACLEMRKESTHRRTAFPEFIRPRQRTRTTPFRLMVFGPPRYKNHDPRADRDEKEKRRTRFWKLRWAGINTPISAVANRTGKTGAGTIRTSQIKSCFPNVDFLSGIIPRKRMVSPRRCSRRSFALARQLAGFPSGKTRSSTSVENRRHPSADLARHPAITSISKSADFQCLDVKTPAQRGAFCVLIKGTGSRFGG